MRPETCALQPCQRRGRGCQALASASRIDERKLEAGRVVVSCRGKRDGVRQQWRGQQRYTSSTDALYECWNQNAATQTEKNEK